VLDKVMPRGNYLTIWKENANTNKMDHGNRNRLLLSYSTDCSLLIILASRRAVPTLPNFITPSRRNCEVE
jgi:hypothetical protein